MLEKYVQYFQKFPIESVAVFVTLFPIWVIFKTGEYKDKLIKYFVSYLLFKFAIDVVMLAMAVNRQNNLFLYNASIIISFAFFARMFFEALDFKRDKQIVSWISGVFCIIFAIDFWKVGLTHSMVISPTIECLVFLVLCMLYFWELTRSLKVRNLLTYSFFWVSAGIFLYFAACTFMYPIFNLVDRWDYKHEFDLLMTIPPIFEIFYLTIISFGIWFSE